MSDTFKFKLPDVGEGIAQAELIEWLVAAGDEVTEDQPIVIIETDKSQLELPSPTAGTVVALRASEGDFVKVGEDLVEISTDGSAATTLAAASISAPSAVSQSGIANDLLDASRRMRPLASPSTRRLALQLGVDLLTIRGSGHSGRILAEDLNAAEPGNAAVETPGPRPALGAHAEFERALDVPLLKSGSPGAGRAGGDPARQQAASRPARQDRTKETTVIELRGLRRQIAKSMTEALRIPHVTEFREIDATALLEARAALRPRFEQASLRLSILPFLVKACTWALARHPSLNAHFDAENERITQYRPVHLGIATATDDGLIVPVLRNSDELSMRQIASGIDRLAGLARTRAASPEELGNGTFTLTNFGSFGTWLGTPIIRPPEVAIAGFGRVEQKVIPVDGVPAVRPVLPIVVAADHRINDGAHIGGLVSDIAAALTQPLLLLDDI